MNDMNEQAKKPRKPLALIIALIAGAVVLATLLGVLLSQCIGGSDSDATIPPEDEYQLYWNLDRELYAGQAADGKTGRETDEKGYYNIRLAYRGKTVTRKTNDRELANEIDSYEILGLTFKDGIITDVLKVEDFTGGYACDGMRTYVTSLEDGKIVAKPSRTGDKSYELVTDSATKVYDVSGETLPVGGVTTLRKDDQFLAVQNKRGVVTDIFVISRADLGNIRYAYCDHCKEEVRWVGWEKVTVLPAADSGHYFLMSDITCKAQTSLQADTQIILDLNGKTIQGKEDARVFSLHNQGCYLAIMDYSEEQTGKVVAGESLLLAHQGACVWVRYGTFELYGGTLDASAVYSQNNGANVCVPKGSVFNMYGGTLTGGTISTKYDPSTEKTSAGMGGNVYVAGTFNMYDGLITKGSAESYYFRDKGTYTNGLGGNVFVAANATFNMTGGVIENGTAHGGGANVFVNARGTFNMSGDAEITGGKTIRPGKNGGSVYIAARGAFTMDGGTISGGATTNCGGNMVVYGVFNMNGGTIKDGRTLDADMNETLKDHSNIFVVNGEMNMTGGYIQGHTYLQSANGNTYNVNISGTAQIKDAAEGYSNLYIRSGHPIHVGTMQEGAEIYVTASGKFTTETAATNKNYFHLDYEGVDVVHYENCLFAGRMGCICGAYDGKHFGECDGTQIAWGAWSSKNSLPTTTGNYYLLYDVDLRGQQSVSSEATIALDLNGKTVTGAANGRIYSLHATEAPVSITMTDSSKEQTGKAIAATVETQNEGLLFWLRRSSKPHTLTIYGGTYDASGVTNLKNGAAIHGTDGSTINIYGGTIIGGTAKSTWNSDKASFSGGRGGTIYTTGNLNMTGGTIIGGKAICTQKDVQVTAEDGTVSVVTKTGDAYGGNIVLVSNAVANITGGTIEGGSAVLGGNIYIGNKAVATLGGVTVKDGVAEKNGGNVYMGQQSRITMTGGAITGGQNTAEGTNGGSIYICGQAKYGNATFVMKGGLVSGGKSMNMGGNFDVRGTLQIEGGEIKDGVSTGDKTDTVHSNIAVVNLGTDNNNGQLIVTGGHIYGGVNSQTASGKVVNCVTVSGNAKITAPEGYLGLTLRGDAYVKVGGTDADSNALGGLTEGAEIWVNQTVGKQVAATGTDTALTQADTAYFKHEVGEYVLEADGMIYLYRTVEVTTAQELHDALQAGYSVVLKNDIDYDAAKIVDASAKTEAPGIINVKNRITLDMKGFTITYTPAADTNTEDEIPAANKFINLTGSSELTITGNGTITHKVVFADADNAAMFRVAAGTLILENGTYERVYADGVTSASVNRYLIWNSGTNSAVEIKDGIFANVGTRVINEKTGVSIYGGSFSTNPADYGVVSGYGVSFEKDSNGTTWYVVEKPVEVGTAQELHDALQAGKSVVLKSDIAYTAADIKDESVIRKVTQIIFNSGDTAKEYYAEAPGIIKVAGYVVLDLNGHTVTYTPAAATADIPAADKFFHIPAGARLTVTGEGAVKHQVVFAEANNASTFRVDANGALVVESGSFERRFAGEVTAEQTVGFIIKNNPSGSAVQIKGGSFNNLGTTRAISGVNGVTVTGGTFNTDPTGYGVADGYYVEAVDNSFTVKEAVAVENAQQLHDALQAGKSVILKNDIVYTCSQITDAAAAGESAGIIHVAGNAELNLNGHTVTYIPDGKADKFINLTDGAALEVTGEGTIIHTVTSATAENGATFRVAAGTLTIENGTFQRVYADGITAEASARAIVWDSDDGAVYIEAGKFTGTAACVTGEGKVDGITGGTFNTDPSSAVAFTYQTKAEGGVYTVIPADKDTVLEVNSAQKLHDALEAGYSVKLIADIEYLAADIIDAKDALTEAAGIINVTGKITLDMNGYAIRYTPAADPDVTDEIAAANKFINLTNNSELTVTGNGKLTHNVCFTNADNAVTFRVAAGTLNIENGSFERVYSGIEATTSNRWIFWNGGSGTVNISGGSFSSVGTREIYSADGVTITAGSFASNPAAYGLAEGYGVAKDTDESGKRWYIVKPAVDVGTAQELHDALQAGLSVNLTGDINYVAQDIVRDSLDTANTPNEAASIINVGGYVTLNMNGYTITYTPAPDGAANKFFNMLGDTGLTVTGNGTIVHNVPYADTDNAATFRVAAGELVIKDGTTVKRVYTDGNTDEQTARFIFWDSGSSKLTIEGGTFTNTKANCVCGAGKNTVITGGKFNIDPSGRGVADDHMVVNVTEDGATWYVIEKPVSVNSAQALHDALQAGKSVILTGDIDYISSQITDAAAAGESAGIINVTGTVGLNLNGYTITYTPDGKADKFINLTEGSELTVMGDGIINHLITDAEGENGAMFRVASGILTVKNGIFQRYYAEGITAEAKARPVIWDSDNGSVYILGGNFYNASAACIAGDGKVAGVTGGIYNTDPSKSVAFGYKATVSEGIYTVTVLDASEAVTVTNAEQLKQALEEGRKVILGSDFTYDLSENITCKKPAELDLNGYTVTWGNNTRIDVYSGSLLTINGNGGIVQNNGMIFRVSDTGQLVINGGMYTASGNVIHAGGNDNDSVTINGGEFYGAVNSYQGSLTISGGTFNAAVSAAAATTCNVTGGTYATLITTTGVTVADGYWLSGPDANGKYQVLEGTEPPAQVSTAQQLKDALEAGKVVVLADNITYDLDENIKIDLSGDPMTIMDMNGKTITFTTNKFIEVYSPLTVKGNGTIDQPNNKIFRVSSKSTLVIENGTYTAKTGERIIHGGGNAADEVIIHGGTFNSWVHMYTGTLTINDGTFFGNVSTTNGAHPVSATISGGTFHADVTNGSTNAESTFTITDGYFKNDPSEYLASTYSAIPVEIDGAAWYDVHEFVVPGTPNSLKAALEAGHDVKLTSNITYNVSTSGTISMGQTASLLNLNGYTITFDADGETAEPIIKMSGTELTVLDTSAEQTGKIEALHRTTGTQIVDLFELNSASALTVNGGTFVNETGGETVDGISGSITLNGGKFSKKPASAAECSITCKSGYVLMVPNGESMYALVAKPADATPVSNAAELRQALEQGEKAWLISDIAITNEQQIDVGNSAVLDLNGFTVTVTNTVDNQPMFLQSGNTTLTVIDGSTAKNGTIKAVVATNGVSSDLFSVGATDTLNIEGGSFVYDFAEGITTAGTSADFISAAGTVNASAGSFENKVGGNIYTLESTGAFKLKVGHFLKDDDGDGVWTVEVLPGVGVNTAEDLKTNLMNGVSVYLTGNIDATWEDSECIAISGKTVTLDLNGFTLNHAPAFTEKAATGTRLFNLLSGTVLTTKDSFGGGVIQTTARMMRVNTGTTWNAEGGTYKCLTSGNNVVFWSSANVTGGSFSQNPASFLAEGCGSYPDSTTGLYVVVPAGQTVTASDAADLRIKLQGGCSVKLTGDIAYTLTDNITLAAGVSATLDLNGYTVSHTGGADRLFALIAGSSTASPSSLTVKDSSNGVGAIESTQNGMFRLNTNATYGNAVLNIEGGRFSCTGSNNVFWHAATKITGGVFSESPASYVAEGYETVGPSSGYYAVVKTVDTTTVEARSAWEVKVALESGKSVILGADMNANWEDSEAIAISGQTVTLDLNGRTLDHAPAFTEKVATGSRLFNLLSSTVLTTKDSVGGGTIQTTARMVRVNTGTTWNVESGTYKCLTSGNNIVFWDHGTVAISGGSFTHAPGASRLADANAYEVTGPVDGLYTVTAKN